MTEARPYSKETQLGAGRKRYRRRVASSKTWERIMDAKGGPCRVCNHAETNGHSRGWRLHFHHVVPRGAPWFGDDVEANIVPVCDACHRDLHARTRGAAEALVGSLSAEEYIYAVERGGGDVFEQVYGIEYER